MKILVLNGSPKKERSDCMKLTRAFLEGMGEQAEVVNAVEVSARPCLGCYACWSKTPGHCVQQDDMAALLEKVISSDLVILSTPLYCYGFPAPLKAMIDRFLPLNTPVQKVAEDGSTYHPCRGDHDVRFVLISGCGFPNLEQNYEGMVFSFEKMFGKDSTRILCCEAPLLNIEQARPVADPYLALVRRAGAEFAEAGRISEETQNQLNTPMFPPDEYRRMSSGE